MSAVLSQSRLAPRWDATRAVTLGLVGGYVDTVGYLMLRGLFPNHVTGNLPIAAADPGLNSVPLLIMVPLWLAAVIAAAWAAGRVESRNASAVLPVILGVEAVLLGLFLLLGVALVPDRDASTLVTQTIVGAAGVSAMGVQSVITRLGGYVFPTTMVTGTLTLLGNGQCGGALRRTAERRTSGCGPPREGVQPGGACLRRRCCPWRVDGRRPALLGRRPPCHRSRAVRLGTESGRLAAAFRSIAAASF